MPSKMNKAKKRNLIGQRIKHDLARKGINDFSAKDRILIVCEDAKITPNYFTDFRTDTKLTSTDVKVCGEECGNAPTSVYEYALSELDKDFKDKGDDSYDRIYCVFDRDGHADFDSTMAKIKANPSPRGKKLFAVPSYPCFEFWILLHFKNVTTPFSKSSELVTAIKKVLDGYDKKDKKFQFLYPYLKDKTSEAIKNSRSVLKQVQSANTDNPSSLIHIVVEDLIEQGKLNK